MPASSVGGGDCSECSEFIVFDPVTLTGCVGFLIGAVGPEIFAGVRRGARRPVLRVGKQPWGVFCFVICVAVGFVFAGR